MLEISRQTGKTQRLKKIKKKWIGYSYIYKIKVFLMLLLVTIIKLGHYFLFQMNKAEKRVGNHL